MTLGKNANFQHYYIRFVIVVIVLTISVYLNDFESHDGIGRLDSGTVDGSEGSFTQEIEDFEFFRSIDDWGVFLFVVVVVLIMLNEMGLGEVERLMCI